ncbi:hypothetical protein [Brevundimonas fontaquae]|uniref:Uncharacterized protein n=1 Tax=Brevundimonas fontaquae TaxID=2813778 RepID=A0ABX7LSW2_9CAUL|nr:hypothetical protein [Brevundimonas fontaquae]QSF55402.1 hypothetical protein JX001_06320 [Brevundimonas fontaquae]
MKLASAAGGFILTDMTLKASLPPLLIAIVVAAGQASAQTSGAPLPASVQTAWSRVRAALTAQQQANEVRGFLSALANENRRPTIPALDARDIASGRAVSLDDPALVQRPQAHEVTVTVDGQFLTYRPLSRASLEPFFGR